MISLNDYLYSGDTVLKILSRYIEDLEQKASDSKNVIDLAHCEFLGQIKNLLEHNDFLTAQSQKIREFYQYMAAEYPYLAFTFKGRIKSLIRAEEKFNGYLVKYIYEYYQENKSYPTEEEMMGRVNCFRDLIAYRIVLSIPRCHLENEESRQQKEQDCLYEIANALPAFLEKRGFQAEVAGIEKNEPSPLLQKDVRPFYRDYIQNQHANGYQSLHITLYDHSANCYIEVQLRTKEMDDYAEIGPANHLGYEKKQERERARRDAIQKGQCVYFDEAYERGMMLQQLDLSKLDVNMFAAADNSLINDGCGLYRGRLILPYEHLSRFQSDLI